MSRRFGRNQRRRAREEIARLHTAHTLSEGLLRHVSDQRAVLQDTLSEARRVLGDHPALPPQDWGHHPLPLGGDFDYPVPQLTNWDLGPISTMGQMESAQVSIVRMHQLLASVNTDRLSGEVHCNVMLDRKNVAYAISRPALLSLSRQPQELSRILARQIAPALASLLSRELCK